MLTAIPLTEAQAAEIERLLACGICEDASEVVAAGLEALAARIEAWLRDEVVPVAAAMEADPSRAMSLEQVFAELRAHHARRVAGG
jgi:antitoxin ParD1/3/4